LGVGTHLKYYINEGGAYQDITPIRATTAAGDVTFTANANTLGADLDIGDTSMTLSSATGFPDTGIVKVNSEIIRYASISGNTLLGLERGYDGTTEAAHTSADAVTCATLIVSDTAHGCENDDFVTYSGASTLGDQITADVLNQEYQIASIVDDDNYLIEAREVASLNSITTTTGYDPTYVFATTSDSASGGASTVGTYQINTGLDTTIGGAGWGAGTWSRGAWGSAAPISVATSSLRIWSHDNFGEDLLVNVRNGGIYYWDRTGGTGARAVSLDSLAGASSTPTIAKQVLVSDRDRHIIAFGCDTESNPGVQDPLAIRFSSQESLTDWGATATNTAGELRLGSGSEIVMAIETRQQVLVFTDESLYAMQYLGPPFTFGVNLVSENITTMGPLAAIPVEDNVYWMGLKEFYAYGGTVQRLPCTVRDYVFDDINLTQREKIVASSNTSFSEVWWFYPSATSDVNDRYVVYNYQQQIWYYGTLERSYWMDRGIFDQPIAAGPNNYLYTQETGFDDDGAAFTAYIESSPVDIGDGDKFAFIKRMIPDVTFRGSTAASPSANFTIKTRNFPGGNYLQSTEKQITKTASVPVEQFTEQVHLRLRGRSFALRVESEDLGVGWRLGSPRLDIRTDGRR
jgi:hypothetical protein